LSTEYSIAQTVGNAIQEQFAALRLKSDVFVSRINTTGARIA
jgi:hypothetical protein